MIDQEDDTDLDYKWFISYEKLTCYIIDINNILDRFKGS